MNAEYGPLLDALRRLRWAPRRAVHANAPGAHLSRAVGHSAEFTEYRPYRQGDEARRIDWRLLARSDRAYVRLATDRARLPTALVLDASASMAFPAGASSKWRQACRVSVALALVAHGEGDPVALALHASGTPTLLPPRTRRGVVSDIARTVDGVTPGGGEPLATLLAPLRRVGRTVVIGDFLGDGDEVVRLLRERVASGGEAHVVHVVAREELAPARAAILAIDPEAPTLRRTLAGDTRAEYLRRFAEWRELLAAACRSGGVNYVLAMSDEPADRVVRRLVEAAPAGAGAS